MRTEVLAQARATIQQYAEASNTTSERPTTLKLDQPSIDIQCGYGHDHGEELWLRRLAAAKTLETAYSNPYSLPDSQDTDAMKNI